MKHDHGTERGQVLIMIAFGIIGLIGMVALAVDGGRAYSDRRHAQNAADTSVLAGARALIREEDWKSAALAISLENGFADGENDLDQTSESINVEIYQCDESDDADTSVDCGEYDIASNPDAEDYMMVKITSIVNTTFATVIGIQDITNTVFAIAHVKPSERTPYLDGNAVIGMSPGDCSAVKYSGSAETRVESDESSMGGIFVNSTCASDAFKNESSGGTLYAPHLCVVGDTSVDPNDTGDAIEIPSGEFNIGSDECRERGYPPANYNFPNTAICDGAPAATVVDVPLTDDYMTPGTWSGTFPPAGVVALSPGLYCVYGDFTLGASDRLAGVNVSIWVFDGDVEWHGGAEVNLQAYPQGYGEVSGLLLYLPLSDPIDYTHVVHLNGNSNSYIKGTVLAPAAECTVNGNGDMPRIDGQFACYTVELSGSSDLYLRYNDDENWFAYTNPLIELTK
jgi:Flp pilus assembly protein TadG